MECGDTGKKAKTEALNQLRSSRISSHYIRNSQFVIRNSQFVINSVLYVESEMHHIPVGHNVFLAFDAQAAVVAGAGF